MTPLHGKMSANTFFTMAQFVDFCLALNVNIRSERPGNRTELSLYCPSDNWLIHKKNLSQILFLSGHFAKRRELVIFFFPEGTHTHVYLQEINDCCVFWASFRKSFQGKKRILSKMVAECVLTFTAMNSSELGTFCYLKFLYNNNCYFLHLLWSEFDLGAGCCNGSVPETGFLNSEIGL